jgi:hypothetical protein
MTCSLSKLTNDSGPSVISSGRSVGDGASDRLARSEIANSAIVDVDSQPLETASSFDLSLMHPQSIFAVLL